MIVTTKMIFVIGGPGSGKGTQCQLFCKSHPDYIHISLGDIVRSKLDSNPEFKEFIKQGQLLNDQVVLNFLREEMQQHPDAAGFLIDGYPRTKAQIELFEDQVTTSYKVLYFDAPSYIVEQRLLNRNEGRDDDNIGTIKKRLQTYKEQTLPAIEYMQQRVTDQVKISYINAALDIDQMAHQVNIAIADKGMVNISLFELMQLYLSCGNIYDAVDSLEKRYEASDFQVCALYFSVFYIIQSRQNAKIILSDNTAMGYQYGHFDTAHGHQSIAGMQTFNDSISNEKNPGWENLHKAIANSVRNDKNLIIDLVAKHMPHILREGTFSLDVAFEEFMVSVWCEYLFGENVPSEEFSETRNKMLAALRYTFYDSRLKAIPYLGEQACKLYRYLNQNTFDDIDDQFKKYISQANDGLICRMRQQLKISSGLSDDQIEKILLDNMTALLLEMDFIHGAMYSTLVEIAKARIDDPEYRKEAYQQGLRISYLFPFRDRVAQNDIPLTNATISKGSHVIINLLKTGLYHSSGPRSCVGIGVTEWIKKAVFDNLKDIVLRVERVTYPPEREKLAHSKDVPVSPERLIVKWKFSRDYLQRILPHYEFKGVSDFYDVLKIHENPQLSHYIKERFIRKINKLDNLDKSKLCIATAEVRGIPIAAMVAEELHVPLVIIRKPGKIPGETIKKEYASAYASDVLEISKTSDVKDKDVVFIDDGLASGGSALACCDLLESLGGKVKEILTVINHEYAADKRDTKLLSQYKFHSLFDFKKPTASANNPSHRQHENKI